MRDYSLNSLKKRFNQVKLPFKMTLVQTAPTFDAVIDNMTVYQTTQLHAKQINTEQTPTLPLSIGNTTIPCFMALKVFRIVLLSISIIQRRTNYKTFGPT